MNILSPNLHHVFYILCILILIYSIIRIYLLRKMSVWRREYPGLGRSISFPRAGAVAARILLLSSTLLCVFLSGWKTDYKDEKREESFRGVDILFLVDVSLSMQAVDSQPNRLAKFKATLLRMLPSLSGNRFGMIVFAGSPFLYCPMTSDVAAFSDYVRGLDADMVGDRGTDLAKAFKKAEDLLNSDKVFRNRILILVTDGEDIGDPETVKFPALFQIWGTGTSSGGPIVYNDDDSGLSGYLMKDGSLSPNETLPGVIRSRMNAEFLGDLADKNGGTFYPLETSAPDAESLKKEIRSLEENLYSRKKDLKRAEGSGKFLLAAVLFLLLDWIFVENALFPRRKERSSLEIY
ncbi:VWA domain-containing protein [Leptospira ellisii]|uniref:VWA domain-containing protein n=3 Tax=Leptospira ellisii TaxID=2023197 RepID=A0AAE4TWI3_9LEPT|nr:VWA domain-containing protein [Leptospira ellisii]MDV6236408.1 VWA domain-containing protein [Leptospira ellisii]